MTNVYISSIWVRWRIRKRRGDTHGKGLADFLAWWEQDTMPGEQTDGLTTGSEKCAGDLVGLGHDLVMIFFGSLRLLEICTRS